MSMSIQEAIQHCREVAAGATAQGKCPECAADHEQLAKWLEELLFYQNIMPLPCKPGDTVYFYSDGYLESTQVDHIEIHKDGVSVTWPCCFRSPGYVDIWSLTEESTDNLGKTWFLTDPS